MRVCFVAEGCYPYVVGGVSGWIHSMIKAFPGTEFVILAIVSDRSVSGKFAYELPENVTEVHEVYLQDLDWQDHNRKGKRTSLPKKEYEALRSLMLNTDVDWPVLFDMFANRDLLIDDLLMGVDFLNITKELYRNKYPEIIFSDFLWTLRSLYLPMFLVMKSDVPKADLYHCVATGYAGILGAMAKHRYGCGLMVSEHGIYTREREEELIKANWVNGVYKSIWIDQFRKMSQLAYDDAEIVTCLFAHAKELQHELGCPLEKIHVTPNGIDTSVYVDIPGKSPEDEKYFNIGAVLRITPIKDVKTMIQAFGFAKQYASNLKLWVMGPANEDPQYAQECYDLVSSQNIKDVVFTGRVNVREYMGRMDCTILTSISEGQPLTILEGYAAHKPVIATDVGNCRGLIYGEDDGIGDSGILTHIMNIEEIRDAMIELATHPDRCAEMGENGYKRVMGRYKIEDMRRTYQELYSRFEESEN